jgi:hypothetical protein
MCVKEPRINQTTAAVSLPNESEQVQVEKAVPVRSLHRPYNQRKTAELESIRR